LHLRTLQTIRDIAADPSEKIVLFLPTDTANAAETVARVFNQQTVSGTPSRTPKTSQS
jgi:hypothetical protein